MRPRVSLGGSGLVGAGTPRLTTCAPPGTETTEGNRTPKQIRQMQDNRFQKKCATRGGSPAGLARPLARASDFLLVECFKQRTSPTSKIGCPVTAKTRPDATIDRMIVIFGSRYSSLCRNYERILLHTLWCFTRRWSPRSSASEGEASRRALCGNQAIFQRKEHQLGIALKIE